MPNEQEQKLATWLRSQGWLFETPHRTVDRCDERWYKRYKPAPQCIANAREPGVQLCLQVYYRTPHFPQSVLELSLTAQKPDGMWVILKVYSDLTLENVEAELDLQAADLVAAWCAIYDAARVRVEAARKAQPV